MYHSCLATRALPACATQTRISQDVNPVNCPERKLIFWATRPLPTHLTVYHQEAFMRQLLSSTEDWSYLPHFRYNHKLRETAHLQHDKTFLATEWQALLQSLLVPPCMWWLVLDVGYTNASNTKAKSSSLSPLPPPEEWVHTHTK